MSNVTPKAFQDEVMTSFASFWAGRSPIASPNKGFDRSKLPASTQAFIEWTIIGRPDGERRLSHSVERNHFRREGTITFTANARSGLGLDPCYDLLDAVQDWLTGTSLTTAIFLNLGSPIPLGDDGAFYQVSLSAGWVYLTDRPSVAT